MIKSSNITLNITDIIKGSYPTHEGRVGDFSVSLVDIVLDKIGGSEMFPNFKIDAWNLNTYGQRVEVKYSWEVLPKIDVEDMEKVVLEIMEKIKLYPSRDITSLEHLDYQIRDVFMDNFEPIED